MNDKELVQLAVSEADSATSQEVTVRTDGDGDDVREFLPLVALKWDATRSTGDEGHSTFYGYATDASGNHIGKIRQMKYNMELDFTFKTEDESLRDELGDTLQRHFLIYEGNTDALHPDTYQVNVGDVRPRKIQFAEPDWYQNGLIVNVRYKKFVTQSGEPIETIQRNINVKEDL